MVIGKRINARRRESWLQHSHSPVAGPYDAHNPSEHERAKSRISQGLNPSPSFVLRNGRKNQRRSPFASSYGSGYWTHIYLVRRSGPAWGNRLTRLLALTCIVTHLAFASNFHPLDLSTIQFDDVLRRTKPSCITALNLSYRSTLGLDPNKSWVCMCVESFYL